MFAYTFSLRLAGTIPSELVEFWGQNLLGRLDSSKMLLVVPKDTTLEKGEKEGLIALVVIRPVFILSMHPSDQHLALHCALLRVYVLLGHEEQHLLRQHHAACGAAWPAAQPRNGKK